MSEPSTDQGTSDATPAPDAGSAGGTAHIPNTGTAPNPQQPVASSSDQTPGRSGEGQPPEGFIPQAKYDGAMRTLSERDKALRKLEAELAQANQQIGELNTTTGAQAADFQTQIATLGEQVTALTGERDQAQEALTAAQADLTKFDALTEFPELLPMAGSIPSLPDKETMVEHLKMIKAGVDQVAEDLAARKVAGMTPGATSPANGAAAYTTQDQWMEALDKAGGTEEFEKLAGEYLAWQQQPQGG